MKWQMLQLAACKNGELDVDETYLSATMGLDVANSEIRRDTDNRWRHEPEIRNTY